MKNLYRAFLGAVISVAALLVSAAPAFATTYVPGAPLNYIPNLKVEQYARIDAVYTNSTATPTAIPAATYTFPATTSDYTKQVFLVCYSADVSKATAGTGTIQVAYNGNNVTAFDRYVASAAGRNTISGCFPFTRTSGAAATVSLLGLSSDTNAFTVTNATLTWSRLSVN